MYVLYVCVYTCARGPALQKRLRISWFRCSMLLCLCYHVLFIIQFMYDWFMCSYLYDLFRVLQRLRIPVSMSR